MTTLIVSALVIVIIGFVSNNNTISDSIIIGILFFLYGILFSLPMLIVYILLYKILIKRIKSTLMIKAILNTVTICGIFITISVIGGTSMTPNLALFYSVVLIVCSFIFKIKKQIITNSSI